MKTQEKRIEPGHPLISRTPGVVGGSPAIDGTRIRVADVVGYTRIAGEQGREALEYILTNFPHLRAEQVAAALRYYDENRDEIDEYIAEEEEITREWIPNLRST